MKLLFMTISQFFSILLISWFFGSFGIVSTAITLFVSAVICFCILGHRTKDWPLRQDVWKMSRQVFGSMWLLGTISYVACFFIFPESFALTQDQLWLIAPFIGLGCGLLSLILTLCAGDTALLILGREESV